jgi:hypothetical protein
MADQRTGGGANGCTNHRASRTASTGDISNDRARASAGGGALASRRIARVQPERGEQNATNNCEKLFVHDDFLVSPLNAQLKRMLRSKNELTRRWK